MAEPIPYGFLNDRPAIHQVLKAWDERAENDGGLPRTPGVFTPDDIAAVRDRDPQAVALISATIESAGLSMLCQGLPPPAPIRCPPNPGVTDSLVSTAITQALAAGNNNNRDIVLSRFASKHSMRLSAGQIVRLANAAHRDNTRNWITLEFVKINSARISVADAVALSSATGDVDHRDMVLLRFAKNNTGRLSRTDLTTLANAAYWSGTKNAIVRLDVDP